MEFTRFRGSRDKQSERRKPATPRWRFSRVIDELESRLVPASANWAGGAINSSWASGINWSPSAAPGATTGTSNADTATFNAAIANTWGDSAVNPVAIDSATRNLKSIIFTSLAGNYFIGSTTGNPLLLTTAGSIEIANTLTAADTVATINAPLSIQGNLYTIANNSASGTGAGAGTLKIGGVIGGTTGTVNLVFDGSNTNANLVSGAVGNGAATTLNLIKRGAGAWELSNSNAFTGTTSVEAGTLILSGNNSTSTANKTVRGTGVLQLNGAAGSLSASSGLFFGVNDGTYAGGSKFIYDNVGASGTTSQTFASLNSQNSQPDDNTVQITRSAAQNVSLIFTTVASNTTENGNVINFVTKDIAGGGVNGVDYKIVLADQMTLKIVKQNAYFNGGDFAVYDTSAGTGLNGFVRGIKYGVDAASATSAGGASFAATTSQEITGTITSQPSVTLASGTLNGSLRIVGASNLTMVSGATLTISGSGNTGSGGLLKTGGGTSVISGGNALNMSNTQWDVRVDGPTDVLNIAMPVTLSGTQRLYKSGEGTLILSSGTINLIDTGNPNGRNRFFINGGVVEVGGSATFNNANNATNQIYLATGTTFRHNSSSATSSIFGSIVGVGNVTVSNGTLTLSGSNSFTGQLTVDGGTLAIGTINNASASGVLGNSARSVILGKSGGVTGVLRYTGATAASTKPFSLASGGGGAFQVDNAAASLTLSGLINGPGVLSKTGPGTLILNNGSNSYSGGTTVNTGTLTATGTTPLGGSTGPLAVNNSNTGAGTDVFLNLSTTAPTTTGSLSGSIAAATSGTNTATINNGGQLFSVNQSTDATFAGVITGGGGFAFSSPNAKSLVLSGVNTYNGPTTINSGTLAIALLASINSSSGISIAAGYFKYNSVIPLTQPITFTGTGGVLSGAGVINSSVNVAAGNTLSPGASIGILTIGNSLTLAGVSDFEVAGASADQVISITTLTYGGVLKISGAGFAAGDHWDLFDFIGQSGSFDNNSVFGSAGDGINLPSLASGLHWQFDYATGVLSVVQSLAAPTVTSIAPVIGPTTGGTIVTILGFQFASITSVTFGGNPASNITVSGTTLITATAPSNVAPGAVDVVVTNSANLAGSLSGSGDFTYAKPAISSVVVNGGPGAVLGGSSWSLAGQNSVVKQILVTFNQAVSLASDAFTVTPVPVSVNPGPGVVLVNGGASPSSAAVTASIAATLSPSSYLLNFSGPGTHAGGVINSGVYDLTTIASKVSANGETMTGNQVTTFFAMFGNIQANNLYAGSTFTTPIPPGYSSGDGLTNAFVDPGSLFQFSDAFGSNAASPAGPPAYNIIFDSNLDGFIDPGDLFAFSDSFGIDWDF